MAPWMQYEVQEDGMISILIFVAGTLLLIASGSRSPLAPHPVRIPRKR